MRILTMIAAFIIAVPVLAKESRDDEWQPIRLPDNTEVRALTSRSSTKVADMARFYKVAKDAKSDCRIKTQGRQAIVCINSRGNIIFDLSYDSVRETLTVSHARLTMHKGGMSNYDEEDLVEMMRDFFK